jgi:hypothetical protein
VEETAHQATDLAARHRAKPQIQPPEQIMKRITGRGLNIEAAD